ncbi:hypothetical protein KUV80_11740 [Fictibacillus nanhaiensis]|uniref:hypothetical protein n=1 Tax=Fictibacillus nanhaiensis TaxID=742169 RepID=UPI001C950387|nr:hypothetical protein [Fictibacillus nanhaiensis]MBY6037334.1 hypothetical protein [Fictibacillus nanhaiensis]
MILIINKKIRRQFVPYCKFPNPFGDEVAEKAKFEEADLVLDENGEQHWVRKRDNFPMVFGRS